MGIPALEFFTSFFTTGTESDDAASREGMLAAVYFLAQLDKLYKQRNPGFPRIYNAGVVYHHDWGVEKWYEASVALRLGYGDCKVFCAWRCCDLWELGVDARPHMSWREIDRGPYKGTMMHHYRVWIPDAQLAIDPAPIAVTPVGPVMEYDPETPGGMVEDPSRLLGLNWEAAYSTTNRKPDTASFRVRLARMMGQDPGDYTRLQQAAGLSRKYLAGGPLGMSDRSIWDYWNTARPIGSLTKRAA